VSMLLAGTLPQQARSSMPRAARHPRGLVALVLLFAAVAFEIVRLFSWVLARTR
jgi:hypothetical protein